MGILYPKIMRSEDGLSSRLINKFMLPGGADNYDKVSLVFKLIKQLNINEAVWADYYFALYFYTLKIIEKDYEEINLWRNKKFLHNIFYIGTIQKGQLIVV